MTPSLISRCCIPSHCRWRSRFICSLLLWCCHWMPSKWFLPALKANPLAGIIMGGHVSVYPGGRERMRRPTPVPEMPARGLIRLYLMKIKISISHVCSLFRRSFLMERPYAENLRSGGEGLPLFAYLLVVVPTLLSLFRAAYLGKDSTFVLGYYRDAFRLSPVQALS